MDKPVFEVGETYRTRGGGTARVICVDRIGHYPIVALVTWREEPDQELNCGYDELGRYCRRDKDGDHLDLLPPDPPKPVRVRAWVNVSAYDIRGIHPKQEVAAAWCGNSTGLYQVEAILTIPPNIAAKCAWLKDAEVIDE